MDTAQIVHAWEDVRAMFNGGTRKRMLAAHSIHSSDNHHHHRRSSSSHGGSGGSGGKGSSISNSHNSTNNLSSSSHSANIVNNNNNNGPCRSPSTTHLHGKTNGHTHHPNSSQQHQIHSNHHHNVHGGSYAEGSPPSSLSVPVSGHNSNNSLLSSSGGLSSQLLSPSTVRLETIWNPGLGSGSPNAPGSGSTSSRLPPLPGSPSLPHLPFHPLSIPWLRRPIFPFPHPFSPAAACHLLGDPTSGMSMPEKLAAARQMNHSAFKPVSSRTPSEHLFTWLNNNNPLAGSLIGAGLTSLPEDLSLHSNNNNNNNNNNIVNFTPPSGLSREESRCFSPKEKVSHHHHQHHANHQVSTTNVSSTNETERRNKKNAAVTSRHQIQILSSAVPNESDDEENVDIESTEVEECSSTSSSWLPQSSSLKVPTNASTPTTTKISKVGRRKRSMDSCSSGGEDESDGVESSKRKRLWDFDSSGESVEGGGGGGRKANEMNSRATGQDDGDDDDEDTDPSGGI
jgi:hypothetical protein